VYLGVAVLPSPTAIAVSGSHVNPACQGHDSGHDESAPFSVTAPSGQTIEAVCIKAGTQEFKTTSNGYVASGNVAQCYLVSGIGTGTVTVTKTGAGSGQNCQDISFIAAFWGEPTPTSTATASPTATSATPTATPSTPTPSATSPGTTSSPAPTATQTPTTPGGTSTPTGTPPPTGTPTATAPPAQTGPVQEIQTTSSAPLVQEVQTAQFLPSTGSGGYLDDRSMAATWFGILLLLSGISTMGYAVRLATLED
jgi:hypothetical protein